MPNVLRHRRKPRSAISMLGFNMKAVKENLHTRVIDLRQNACRLIQIMQEIGRVCGTANGFDQDRAAGPRKRVT